MNASTHFLTITTNNVVRDTTNPPRALARADLRALDVGTGMRTHALRDAVIGGVIGAGFGALATTVGRPAADIGPCPAVALGGYCDRRRAGNSAATAATIGGALGIVGGWAIGRFIPTEQWAPVAVRIAPANSPFAQRGTSLSLQMRF